MSRIHFCAKIRHSFHSNQWVKIPKQLILLGHMNPSNTPIPPTLLTTPNNSSIGSCTTAQLHNKVPNGYNGMSQIHPPNCLSSSMITTPIWYTYPSRGVSRPGNWEATESDPLPAVRCGRQTALQKCFNFHWFAWWAHLFLCVRVRVRVSITGSVSYLNKKFVVALAFVSPSVDHNVLPGGIALDSLPVTGTRYTTIMPVAAGYDWNHHWHHQHMCLNTGSSSSLYRDTCQSMITLTLTPILKDRCYTHGRPCVCFSGTCTRPAVRVRMVAIHTADNSTGTHQTAPQTLTKYKILI